MHHPNAECERLHRELKAAQRKHRQWKRKAVEAQASAAAWRGKASRLEAQYNDALRQARALKRQRQAQERELPDVRDQYGNPAPKDLVMLQWSDWEDLVGPQVDRIEPALARLMAARWYEPTWPSMGHAGAGYLLASLAEIDPQGERDDPTDPSEWGLAPYDTQRCQLFLIDRPLKRWSKEDGFYHA